MLRHSLGEFVKNDAITQLFGNFYLHDLGLWVVRRVSRIVLDARNGPFNQVFITRNRLLLQPNVELILNKLHFEIRITIDPFIISQHPLRLQ